MGYDQRIFLGACIRIPADNDEVLRELLHETHVDVLSQINGHWCKPEDGYYYVTANEYRNGNDYGKHISEGDREGGERIDTGTLLMWLNNFNEDYKEEIRILKEAYGDTSIIAVFLVNGGS